MRCSVVRRTDRQQREFPRRRRRNQTNEVYHESCTLLCDFCRCKRASSVQYDDKLSPSLSLEVYWMVQIVTNVSTERSTSPVLAFTSRDTQSKVSVTDPIRTAAPPCLPTISTALWLPLLNRHACLASPVSHWIQNIQDTVGIQLWRFWPSRNRRYSGNLYNDHQTTSTSGAM